MNTASIFTWRRAAGAAVATVLAAGVVMALPNVAARAATSEGLKCDTDP